MANNSKKGRIPFTATEQIKKGKVLRHKNWIVGRTDPSTALKSIQRKAFTNDTYEGKTKGEIVIVSNIQEVDRPWTDMIPSFLGGTEPQAQFVYYGRAVDDSRHDGCGESYGADDNIYEVFPKFHVAEGLMPEYNNRCRVRYYDTNNNFVGVVGIITEIIGSETNTESGPSRAGRRPAPVKAKPWGKIPNPNEAQTPSAPIYPYNPITGQPVKAVSDIAPFITSRPGPRNPGVQGGSKYHMGVDFEATLNQKIYAAMGGEIAVRANKGTGDEGFGYYVVIKTVGLDGLGPLYTLYGHLGADIMGRFPRTFNGTTIDAGAQIGIMKNTGTSSGPHLHFGLVYNGNYASPGAVAKAHSQTVFDPMNELFGRVFSRS